MAFVRQSHRFVNGDNKYDLASKKVKKLHLSNLKNYALMLCFKNYFPFRGVKLQNSLFDVVHRSV